MKYIIESANGYRDEFEAKTLNAAKNKAFLKGFDVTYWITRVSDGRKYIRRRFEKANGDWDFKPWKAN